MTLSLFPEREVAGSGFGTAIALGPWRGRLMVVTLGIHRMVERQTLDINILGSKDGVSWGLRPIEVLPRKYFCGDYVQEVDLSDHPDVKYIRIEYHVNRPGAQFSLDLEPASQWALAAAV